MCRGPFFTTLTTGTSNLIACAIFRPIVLMVLRNIITYTLHTTDYRASSFL
jgi:hypothetical protein